MRTSHHILGSASNLIGITFLIIVGTHIANAAERTLADEVAWLGALCFSISCALSYLSIRRVDGGVRLERAADVLFLIGLLSLILSVALIGLLKVA